MKIRIKDNSIRLRLSQTEVADFNSKGEVVGKTDFGPGAYAFNYALRSGGDSVQAEFINGWIVVTLPSDIGKRWASSDEVSVASEQSTSDGAKLRILVEKDFACLTVREGEDESDNFPNPNTTC